MGEHITTRPTGPTYVPGTLKGQSSPFASDPNAIASNPTAKAESAAPAITQVPVSSVPTNPVNPAQSPRTKFSAPTPGSPIKLAGQALRMPSAIGTANTGFRRFSA